MVTGLVGQGGANRREDMRAVQADSPPSTISYDLIFVHGTWARNSEYGRRGTPFVEDLMAFAGSSATHHRFTWEGWNRVGARERGCKEFKEFVAGLPPKAPNTKRVAICHSHGGSVALSALQDTHIASSFDGLVSIGTPFLHVYRLAEVEPSILPPYSIIPAMLAWIAPVVAIWLAFGSPQRAVGWFASTFGWMHDHPIVTTFGVAGVYLFSFLAFGIHRILPLLYRWRGRSRPFDLDHLILNYRDDLTSVPSDSIWKMKERCRLPHSHRCRLCCCEYQLTRPTEL
jgi:hypothetical protein